MFRMISIWVFGLVLLGAAPVTEQFSGRVLRLETPEGPATGFIDSSGLVITSANAVANASRIGTLFRGVEYVLVPFYKDRRIDLAVLYPSQTKQYNRYSNLRTPKFDNFNLSNVVYGTNFGTEEEIVVTGYPFGVNEVKRVQGRSKSFSSKRDSFVCDLPLMRGMSGGPVLNRKNELVGILTGFESEPTGTEFLHTYVFPVAKVLDLLKTANVELAELVQNYRVNSEVAVFDLSEKNVQLLVPKKNELLNCNWEFTRYYGNVIRSTDAKSAWMSGDSMTAASMYFDLYFEKSMNLKVEMTIFLRYVDDGNYLALKVSPREKEIHLVSRKQNADREIPLRVNFSVLENEFYNFEMIIKNHSAVIYFDNIPIMVDTDVEWDRGRIGFRQTGSLLLVKYFIARKSKLY